MSKLLCTKSMAAHWGIIFEYGKYYDYTICEKEVTFITNYNDWDNCLSEIVQNGFQILKLRNNGTDVTWLVKKNKVLEKKKKECLHCPKHVDVCGAVANLAGAITAK